MVLRRSVVSVAVMLLASAVTAAPGNYLIDTWRWDDDLPRDGIHSIAQGSDGYLWVSSRYGLARFDGARFASFSASVGDVFAGHHYPNITADRFGTIWIGTPGAGLLRWRDRQMLRCVTPGSPVFGPLYGGLTNAEGRNLAMTLDGRVLGWSNGASVLVADASRWAEPVGSSICEDRSGNIWFVTYQHRLVRVRGTNAEEMVYGTGDERRNWIALQTDGAGELWAGTQRGIGVWREDRFQPITSPVEPFPVDDVIAVNGQMHRIWVVALGKAWLMENGRWVTNIPFEPVAGTYETSPRMADRAGNLWFAGTKGGLSRASPDGSLLTITENDGLPPGRLAELYEDREGSIWIGIEHAGLARLRNRYFTPVGTHEGARAAPVWSVIEDSTGAIWLGTEGAGLHRWQEGKFTQFRVGIGDMAGSAYSICLDRQGRLWVGTGDNGVLRFENGKFVPVSDYPGPGWNKRVYVIFEDRVGGGVWFGTGLGLFCWRDGELRRYNGKDFEMGIVRVIAHGPDGKLWFGLSGGSEQRLARLDGDAVVAQGADEGLTGHDVFGLHAYTDGSLWICTVGDGLWRWRDSKYAHYTTPEGLPDARIYSIEEDGIGNLWLGSPAGIMRLGKAALASFDQGRTNRLECLLYDRSDGLPTRECSGGAQPSIHRTRDGRLLFAMTDGAVALSPGRVEVNPLPPPVLVEGVRVDGKEQVDGGGNIGPGRHVVEFHYTATSLVAPAKVRFRCRLDGVDEEWRDAGASRSAMYSLTAPGAYRFRVAACNNDGIWNEAGAEASVMVVPYVWQRLWFRFGAIGAVLGIIGGSIRFVERRKLQRRLAQLEMQQMVERERARIARDIHDDLGASLTEMSLLGEFAQRESGEQVKADVRKMAEKARSSTKALDEIVWAVNPRHDTLEGFVNYACSYAQEQLSLAGIRCRIEAPSPVPRRVLRADKRHHLFLAFKEAITNIVKHARASEAQMRITTDDDSVRVMITDNGSGFDCSPGSSRASLGNGLTNMKERLQSVGGTFACESTPGNGTHIKLTIKLTCE